MSSSNDQPGTNHIAGNAGGQPAHETTKMGADAQNTNANSSLQPATPAMQSEPPSSKDLVNSEMEAGQGAVEDGGQQENREASPADVEPKPTGEAQSLHQLADKSPQPTAAASSDTSTPPSTKELINSEMAAGQGAVEAGGEQENREASPSNVPDNLATGAPQPDTYGGNFGNDVQGSFQDLTRADNQRADANRGEFGEQGTLGATHGGYGNQYRETYPAAEHPTAEATEEKYYGEGAARPGPQHNAYRAYDGQDRNPAEQGHAVRDTPTPPTMDFGDTASNRRPTDGRGNAQDNRNLPTTTGEAAAFQNDNGSPTVGQGYAADYGHTSGVGLPAGTTGNHLGDGTAGRNQQEDARSSRGGYDNQGSQGGRSHDQQPGGNAPAGQGAPAPIDSPSTPQTEGYGYGHARSEEAPAGNPDTGDSRNGFGPAGSQEGNVSQGHGSQGGSYDDQNPGARGPEYDNFTQQDKAQNYGQDKRDDFRPADGDKPQDADDSAPRRNAGRDEE